MAEDSFHGSKLYHTIVTNDIRLFEKLAGDTRKKQIFRKLSSKGETYLHLAIEKNCDLDIIKGLLDKVRLGQRNVDCKTALELALEKQNPQSVVIARLHREYILDCIKDGKVKEVEELVIDGWGHWPVKGMPEFEQFAEAPMYLTQRLEDVRLNATMHVFMKKQLNSFIDEFDLEDAQSLENSRDLMGLTLLHKAVLFRDVTSVIQIIGLKNAKNLLALQDNMGRTVLHYSSCFNEHNEIRLLFEDEVKKMSVYSIMEVADKTGFTPLDYVKKLSKIDTRKVANLAAVVAKCEYLERLFLDISSGSYFDRVDIDDGYFAFLLKNSNGTALLDVTGRSLLHKIIIFGQFSEMEDCVKKLLDYDKDNVLYKSRDLWGRTPMHYAYMLNNTKAMQVLTTKRLNITLDDVSEVKQMKDYEGKTVDDYHLEEDDAAMLQENLQKTFILLYQVRPIRYIHQTLQSMVAKIKKQAEAREPSDWDDNSDDDSDDDSDDVDRNELDDTNCEDEYEFLSKVNENEENNMLFHMKDLIGNTLAHYAVRFDNEKLQDMITDSDAGLNWMEQIRDNLGRTPLHFISQLSEESSFKDLLEDLLDDLNPETQSDASSVESSKKDALEAISTNASSEETSGDENAADEDSEYEDIFRSKTNGKKRKKLHRPVDLMGKTPADYGEGCSEDDIGEDVIRFIEFITDRLQNLSTGTYVDEKRKRGNTSKVQIQVHGVEESAKPLPSVKPARFSAAAGTSHIPHRKPDPEDATPFDSEYLKKELGVTLTGALSDISLTRPADPIEYLAHYLYKHAENTKRKVRFIDLCLYRLYNLPL